MFETLELQDGSVRPLFEGEVLDTLKKIISVLRVFRKLLLEVEDFIKVGVLAEDGLGQPQVTCDFHEWGPEVVAFLDYPNYLVFPHG